MQREFAYQSQNGSGSNTSNFPSVVDDTFIVERIVAKVVVHFANSAGSDQTVGGDAFGHNTRINGWYKDGSPWLQNMPLLGIEWGKQILEGGLAGALVEAVDKTVTASATDESETYYVDIPVAQPLAKQPKDFAQSLSNFGKFEVVPGNTGNANVTVVKTDVYLTAFGRRGHNFQSGSRLCWQFAPSNAPLTQDRLSLKGDKLLALLQYTYAYGTVPLAGTKPEVRIDSQKPLLKYTDLDVLDVQKNLGQLKYGSFAARSGMTQTKVAALVVPPNDMEIGELPQGETIIAEYASNASSSTGYIHYVIIAVAAKRPGCRRQYPGAEQMGPAALEAHIKIPQTDFTAGVPDALRPFLPEIVEVADNDGNCG